MNANNGTKRKADSSTTGFGSQPSVNPFGRAEPSSGTANPFGRTETNSFGTQNSFGRTGTNSLGTTNQLGRTGENPSSPPSYGVTSPFGRHAPPPDTNWQQFQFLGVPPIPQSIAEGPPEVVFEYMRLQALQVNGMGLFVAALGAATAAEATVTAAEAAATAAEAAATAAEIIQESNRSGRAGAPP